MGLCTLYSGFFPLGFIFLYLELSVKMCLVGAMQMTQSIAPTPIK